MCQSYDLFLPSRSVILGNKDISLYNTDKKMPQYKKTITIGRSNYHS